MKQLNEVARMQQLVGITEIKINKPGVIQTYEEFVDKFNKVFSNSLEELDIQSINEYLDDADDGETLPISLNNKEHITEEEAQNIFDSTFNKYKIYAEVEEYMSLDGEDDDSYFTFYLEQFI